MIWLVRLEHFFEIVIGDNTFKDTQEFLWSCCFSRGLFKGISKIFLEFLEIY